MLGYTKIFLMFYIKVLLESLLHFGTGQSVEKKSSWKAIEKIKMSKLSFILFVKIQSDGIDEFEKYCKLLFIYHVQ